MCVRQVPNVWWLPWGMFNPDRPAHVHITWRNLWSHAYGAKTPAKCEPTPPMDPVAGYQPRHRALCLPPYLPVPTRMLQARVGRRFNLPTVLRSLDRLFVCLFVCARYIWLHDSLKDVVVTPYLTERTDAYFVLSKKVRPSLASCQQYPIERATSARAPHPPPRACATCTCTPYLRCSPVLLAAGALAAASARRAQGRRHGERPQPCLLPRRPEQARFRPLCHSAASRRCAIAMRCHARGCASACMRAPARARVCLMRAEASDDRRLDRRRPTKMLYASSPDRGLWQLLNVQPLWPSPRLPPLPRDWP